MRGKAIKPDERKDTNPNYMQRILSVQFDVSFVNFKSFLQTTVPNYLNFWI